MFGIIKDKIDIMLFRRKWRKKNNHNTTIAGNQFDLSKFQVGKYTYGSNSKSLFYCTGGNVYFKCRPLY